MAVACSPKGGVKSAADPGALSPDSPASRADSTALTPTRAELPIAGADAGLEATLFLSAADEIDAAAALLPYADGPTPLPPDLRELWSAHGLRVLSVPLADVPALTAALRPAGTEQRQWLGQAYAWTEVARGSESAAPRTVALDAERVRLEPGALRLLVRSWLEPAPPSPPGVGEVKGPKGAAAHAPEAVLRTEIVPQNREARPRSEADAELRLTPPSIAPETQGQLFSRLYARLTLPPGRALVIVPERPGVRWRDEARRTRPPERPIAAEAAPAPRRGAVPAYDHDNPWAGAVDKAKPPEPAIPPPQQSSEPGHSAPQAPQGPAAEKPARGAGGVPPVGVVVRGEGRDRPRESRAARDAGDAPAGPAPIVGPAGPAGPAAVRIPSLGEAMLMRVPGKEGEETPAGEPLRAVLVLTPRVPAEFRLLGQ